MSAVISAFTLLQSGNLLPQFPDLPQKLFLLAVKLTIFSNYFSMFFPEPPFIFLK